MNLEPSKEKAKPFWLVKYFTITSLIVIFVGALILSILNTYWARAMLLKKSEDYALVLVENLNHQVFLQFVIPVALKYGKIQLREKEQFEWMDKVVRSTLHSFKVDMVNIYDMKDTISYSFNKTMIGKTEMGGMGYKNAVSGNSTSKLIQSGDVGGVFPGYPKDSKMVTFAPLRAERPLSRISGPVLGVVEIVQDLSEDYKQIFEFQIRVVLTCTLVMGVLFIVLLFVVRRGEGIIQRRAIERLKLEEQLRRAEHLSSLGEMVAAVSHEIRNPLGIIRSSAELLKKKVSGGEGSPNAIPDIIVEEAGRLNDIITDFLNFAKPNLPDLILCDISEVLEKNTTYLAAQIEKGAYQIEKDYHDNLPKIMADSAMLYQAFLNILINAMQAMPGGGRIDIKIDSNNNSIMIYFEDEGEGISEDLLEKIWDPFFTTKEKGTGLGLGIVKNIVESHSGGIEIVNKTDGGARVIIELPTV
jgi:two-component system sensor histidine kinase HydH